MILEKDPNKLKQYNARVVTKYYAFNLNDLFSNPQWSYLAKIHIRHAYLKRFTHTNYGLNFYVFLKLKKKYIILRPKLNLA